MRGLVLAWLACAASFSPPRRRPRRVARAMAVVEKSDAEWRAVLSEEAYKVLREEGTEPPRSSPLNDVKAAGTWLCAGCQAPLYVTETKFESGSGWPSFFAPIDERAVELATDFKMLVPRTEVRCRACGGHLGHVFDDGPKPTGQRFCMNGVAMDFRADADDEDLAQAVAARRRAAASTAMKPPLGTVLPQLAINAGVSLAFLASFVSRGAGIVAAGSDSLVPTLVGLFPLVMSAIYASLTFRDVQRLLS